MLLRLMPARAVIMTCAGLESTNTACSRAQYSSIWQAPDFAILLKPLGCLVVRLGRPTLRVLAGTSPSVTCYN